MVLNDLCDEAMGRLDFLSFILRTQSYAIWVFLVAAVILWTSFISKVRKRKNMLNSFDTDGYNMQGMEGLLGLRMFRLCFCRTRSDCLHGILGN